MSRRKTLMMVWTGALALGVSGAAEGQTAVRIVGNDVRHAVEDFAAIWISPLRGSPRDYLIAGAVLAAGAAVSPLDDNVDRWAIRNGDRGVLDAISPFRQGGDLYSINKAGPYVAGLYAVSVAINNRRIRDGIFGCVAAYGANTTIRHQVVYRLVGRDRPEPQKNPTDPGNTPTPAAAHGDQYDFNLPADGYGQHSFPGGHVATMATCASFLSHRFEMGLVEPVLVGLVAAMGVGRMADRGHWLSDQVIGTAFGFAVGREVARRQLRRLDREAERNGSSSGSASTGSAATTSGPFVTQSEVTGTRIGWQFRF